jgi:hypothetical protein
MIADGSILVALLQVVGAVFVYQVALWYRHEHGMPLNIGMNAFLRAA